MKILICRWEGCAPAIVRRNWMVTNANFTVQKVCTRVFHFQPHLTLKVRLACQTLSHLIYNCAALIIYVLQVNLLRK